MTVEDGAELVCEGNNTGDHVAYGEGHANYLSADHAPITGVAEEPIVHDDD